MEQINEKHGPVDLLDSPVANLLRIWPYSHQEPVVAHCNLIGQ